MPTITRLVRKTAMFSGQVVAIQWLIHTKTFSHGQSARHDYAQL